MPPIPNVASHELSSGITEYCTHFQALADAADHMVWRFGPDGQCKYFNRRWLAYRGRTAEQERGAGWMEGVHPEDLPRCTATARSAFETRQPFHLEFRVRRADTSYAWVHGHAVPQYLLNGSFVGYVGSLDEIGYEDSGSVHTVPGTVETSESARLALCHIAASLGQSVSSMLVHGDKARKQRTALPAKAVLKCLDLSVTPLVVVDSAGQAVYCNQSFNAFAANARPVEAGVPSKITEWPTPRTQLLFRRNNTTQATVCPPEVQAWLDSDSAKLEQDVRVSAQTLTVGGNDWIVLSVIDTRRENRTRFLERAFLHDLVNAAGSIQMLIDLLAGGASRQERAEYLKLLQVSINRLLSEIYHEKMMLDSTDSMPVDNVNAILVTLADYYGKQPFARGRRINIEKLSAENMKLRSDPTLLFRVLDNMLRNAIEATGQGDVVTLGCRQIEGALEFWVHNPNNIPENVRKKIFRPSFKLKGGDAETETQENKLLREMCGGTVSVCCEPEFGTTYSIRYPASAETLSSRKRYGTKHAS